MTFLLIQSIARQGLVFVSTVLWNARIWFMRWYPNACGTIWRAFLVENFLIFIKPFPLCFYPSSGLIRQNFWHCLTLIQQGLFYAVFHFVIRTCLWRKNSLVCIYKFLWNYLNIALMLSFVCFCCTHMVCLVWFTYPLWFCLVSTQLLLLGFDGWRMWRAYMS